MVNWSLENMLQGWKYRPDVRNFLLVKQNARLVKLIKHKKHPDVSDVLNNVLIIFRELGFKRFSKGFKNAKIPVLEHPELNIFFTAQP